jgi:hypothetical protein
MTFLSTYRWLELRELRALICPVSHWLWLWILDIAVSIAVNCAVSAAFWRSRRAWMSI